MKQDIHPKYNSNVTVICSCGNTFVTGSTIEDDSIKTEFCSQCHPFYTGEQKIVDTQNRVARFEAKKAKAENSFRSKREKMRRRKQKATQMKNKSESTQSLKDMLTGLNK